MNYHGIIIGAAVFVTIGLFHPLVIKLEYLWGKKTWWLFLILGIVCTVASLLIPSFIGSTIVGAVAFSSFWGIHEVIRQEKRVLRGWFPENPARHGYYENLRKKLQ